MNKTELAHVCKALLQEKMLEAETAMKAAQESANSNEKSSMGDKYETGRAMGQLDRDMHAKRLAALQVDYRNLLKIDTNITHAVIELGALVQTDTFWYWIAVALGPVVLNQNKFMVLSPQSPLAQVLLGKKAGDVITFNAKKMKILNVY
ncbi:MAG: GreA/GreB family elongation factor [Bacteroidia bacterium]|nr:GreA/GreB family elongation factor [Bacteroidia bacterium]